MYSSNGTILGYERRVKDSELALLILFFGALFPASVIEDEITKTTIAHVD